ncbi:tapasin [Sarcophilus harrisii]|uniref:TAP binding protein n=1 Tax=Sarcophilus harrisii TaxID=9305 RepID=A0A7N4P8V6_SARHA|nr:tapasin [Sarcophilus harrisii]
MFLAKGGDSRYLPFKGKVKLKGEPLNGCSSCWRGLGRGTMKPLYLLLTVGILAVRRCTARLGPSELECWFVEEQGGGRGMLQGVTKRPAVLLLRQGTGEPPPRPDLDSSLYLKVHDPAGSLGDSLKGSVAPSCELNRYVPSPATSDWAAVLTPEPYSPRSLDGTWLVVSLSSPQVCLSSLLQLSQSQSATSSVTIATAVLTVLSHSPVVLVGPGENATLDLSFTYSSPHSSGASSSLGPPPFGLEWRRQHRGTGQLLLAVTPGLGGQALGSPEGAVAFATWDEKGVASPWSGNGTLLLPDVKPHQEGTYLATVHLPHLQTQVALKLKIQKPPKVSLTPSPMVWAYPGQAPPELLCLISHFYPLEELQVSWEFQNGTGGGRREAGGQAWRSSYRYHPDGTISVSAHLRPPPVTVEQHGSRYICVVHHSSLQSKGLSAQVSLEVAGISGPSLEDGVGLFLSAFLLLGLLKGMEWIMSFRSPSPDTKEKKSY